jgi:predicted SnoaL-like aldol condensation-catalyzing enzyme
VRTSHFTVALACSVVATAGALPTHLVAQRTSDVRAAPPQVVQRWVEAVFAGDWETAGNLTASQYTLHDTSGTTVLGRQDLLGQLAEEWHARGSVAMRQIEVFGDQDKIFVLYAADTQQGHISAVECHRVADGRVVETWRSGTAEGLAWSWDSAAFGDSDVATKRRVFSRWYDGVYGTADWRSIPEVVGDSFVRHEDREFVMSAEEYTDRIRPFLETTGPLKFDYDVVTGADKVAVIGRTPDGLGFLQAWRVSNDRLVESWWVPVTARW